MVTGMNDTPHDWLTRLADLAQQYPYGDTVFTVVLFLFVLSVLVFFHELGHYVAARSVGIRVEAFSIGFGREILGFRDKHGTRWKFGWIPLGGYVQMRGQEDLKPIEDSVDPLSYGSKTLAQRAWVIVAGPLANLVLGFVLLVAIMLTGEHRLKPEVGAVQPDMPAFGVLQKGDTVVAIDGQPIVDWDAMQSYVSERAGQPLAVRVMRNGAEQEVQLTPSITRFTDRLGDEHTVGRVGIAPSMATFVTVHPAGEALMRAAERTWQLTYLTVLSLYKLLIGAISPDNLTGPLGIADMTGQAASSGTFALLMFMVVISINLCVVNLFPLPVLDGGHLVLLALEGVRGRPLGATAQEWLMRTGLALIVMLALFSTFNDTKRMGLFGAPDAAQATQAAE